MMMIRVEPIFKKIRIRQCMLSSMRVDMPIVCGSTFTTSMIGEAKMLNGGKLADCSSGIIFG